jgi:LysM repeat protein
MTGAGRSVIESITAIASRRSPSHEYSAGVRAVAVSALVPGHHAPAGGGQLRCEHVVGAGEVEAAVHQEHRVGVGRAPLVHGELHPAGVDVVLASRRLCPREVHRCHSVEARPRGTSRPNRHMIAHVKRARLGLLAGFFIALPMVATACGDDASSGGTLPPIITTTTSTTVITTTTTIPQFYTVQSGDTLDKIANMFGVTRDALMAINGITDPDHIELGEELQIPPPAPETTTTSSTVAP